MKTKKRYKYSCHFCGEPDHIHRKKDKGGILRRVTFGRNGVYLCNRCYNDYWNYEVNSENAGEPIPDPADMKTVQCTHCAGSGYTAYSANNDYRPDVQIQCWACQSRGFWLTTKSPLELLADCAPED